MSGRSRMVGPLAAAVAWVAACGPGEAPVSEDVVAVVDDIEITRDRLERAIDQLYSGEDGRQARRSDEVARQVLDRLVDMELLVKAAERKGLDRDLKVEGRVLQRQRELLLEELFRRGVVKEVSQVTDEGAREYFDHHHIGEQRRVRRILTGEPQAATQVITRVRNGEDFAELARELSDDPETSAQGGDLGWLSRLHFRNFVLRRQVFAAEIGKLIGPVQEPDGFSVLTVEAVREVPYSAVKIEVMEAVREEAQSLATFAYLERLATDSAVEVDEDALGLLMSRLTEAGTEAPEMRRGEARRPLLRRGDQAWPIGRFLEAMSARKDPVEIIDADGLRRYARRLFAYEALLPERARELGLDETESVRDGVRKVRREALMDRLREIEVSELIEPSPEQVRAFYDRNQDIYVRPERISILEVLVDSRQEADDLVSQLDAGGQLEELARKYSMRSSRVRRAGGRIQLMRPDKYGRVGFEASEAEVGQIVGPVKTMQGYSVFKVLKKIPGYQQSFEEVAHRALWHLEQELAVERFAEYVAKLREQRSESIRIIEPHLQALLKKRSGGA